MELIPSTPPLEGVLILEKRREPKGNKKEANLEESSFRQLDFTPLVTKEAKEPPKPTKSSEIIEDLAEIEKDVLSIAENILKLKRYDADFDIEIDSESELQKYPILEKL